MCTYSVHMHVILVGLSYLCVDVFGVLSIDLFRCLSSTPCTCSEQPKTTKTCEEGFCRTDHNAFSKKFFMVLAIDARAKRELTVLRDKVLPEQHVTGHGSEPGQWGCIVEPFPPHLEYAPAVTVCWSGLEGEVSKERLMNIEVTSTARGVGWDDVGRRYGSRAPVNFLPNPSSPVYSIC